MGVGVFMDQSFADVVATVEDVGVDAVQLHGAEDVNFLKSLREALPSCWIIRVVHLPPCGDADTLGEQEMEELKRKIDGYRPVCDIILLDTAMKSGPTGGTGVAFNWDVARHVQDVWKIPVIVAGGLTGDNVAGLVEAVAPFGVDVASGVEVSPGVKDEAKTVSYVQNAKRARLNK